MGLLQRAIETYDANAALIGAYIEGKEPLAPIGHVLTRADLEITINREGKFLGARRVEKTEGKILIPVTEESGSRTNSPAAHPLCDQLKYVSALGDREHDLYCEGLREWMNSTDSHPFLRAIFTYVESETILDDLEKKGLLDGAGKDSEKQMVRWRVIGFEGEEPACWKNRKLFSAFVSYYSHRIADRDTGLCMVEGKEEALAAQHPKGIIPVNGNAKLISANDKNGFTYRGRFLQDWQAETVGYEASQKAHNALRWLASEEGVREFSGSCIFLCWNPKGKEILKPMRGIPRDESMSARKPSDYREKLRNTLLSFRKENQLCSTDSVILASFDAATTGRLALTYYNEISLDTFLDRMQKWDDHCCWYGKNGISAANLPQIVDCAFGTQRNAWLETDERVRRQHLQRLLNCKINGGIFPADVVMALTQRASMPQNYDKSVWRQIVQTACSALQKYRYDTNPNQGGNEMAWELDRKDRSFQYGRLLAVMERLEEDYYKKTQQESRQTSAIKYMSEFRKRPFTVFGRVDRHLQQAYLNRVDPWAANRYRRLKGEIVAILSEFPEAELNRPLSDLYLMGYELQRNAFFTKKDANDTNTEEE